jgi:hypothetical protein
MFSINNFQRFFNYNRKYEKCNKTTRRPLNLEKSMPPDIPTNEFEADNDSLYVMPLALVPFETPGLARGRLRMNGALDHVIDVFNDSKGRSGYILLEDINQKLGHQNSDGRRATSRTPIWRCWRNCITCRALTSTACAYCSGN